MVGCGGRERTPEEEAEAEAERAGQPDDRTDPQDKAQHCRTGRGKRGEVA